MTRNSRFLIDNLASADPSFGDELHRRSFLVDIIDLVIALSIKRIKINRKYMSRLFQKASVKTGFLRTRVVKRRKLLYKQGSLNCPQFSSFLYAHEIAVII